MYFALGVDLTDKMDGTPSLGRLVIKGLLDRK